MPNVWSGINKKTFAQVVNGDAVGKMNEESIDSGANALGKIKIRPLENEWLCRIAVASLHQPMSINEIENKFLNLGVDNIQIRAMGGRSILLTMSNQLTRDETIKEYWIHRWFSEVKPWDRESASLDRFTWISCHGIPLDAMEVVDSTKHGVSKTHEDGEETSSILKMAQPVNDGLQAEIQGDVSDSLGLLNSRVEDSFVTNQDDRSQNEVGLGKKCFSDHVILGTKSGVFF
ncbi:hypothetical protein Vadar_022668 [Vaccinium darrowii]|uniref:Uncharacterized protein n=1 Tax=Vaccinium darrowii TaxID=229202 RepID=A0ACB7Y8M2_9ERIC|nr:hypothetical protein Vadar_022668 [Vaccinium darrowii]